MPDWFEIVMRLGAATLAGGLIGLNRDLHGKPIGLKTLGLVGLATAMVVMLAAPLRRRRKNFRCCQPHHPGHPHRHWFSRRRRHRPRRASLPGPRADQRRLYLARGLRRHCLRGRTMADCHGRRRDHVRHSDHRRPNRALAACCARRQGTAGAEIRPRLGVRHPAGLIVRRQSPTARQIDRVLAFN